MGSFPRKNKLYLFYNADLAEMLLKNWSYDEDSLGLFKHYRISSNAVYPFRSEGRPQLLRFAPKSEKLGPNLKAELEFLRYLHAHQFEALEAVPSRSGSELVEAETPWGTFYATVFKRVAGTQLSRTEFNAPPTLLLRPSTG